MLISPTGHFPPIILASKSPRRQEILQLMGMKFRVVLREVDESFPTTLPPEEIAVYIAEKKMQGFEEEAEHELVITADTIVVAGAEILGKPVNEADACRMLALLSGREHQVITGVSLLYKGRSTSFFDRTTVYFRKLDDHMIRYYIGQYQPMDKAGAYGIQEWIGVNAIEKIEGSYSNVVGLPSEKLYTRLGAFLGGGVEG